MGDGRRNRRRRMDWGMAMGRILNDQITNARSGRHSFLLLTEPDSIQVNQLALDFYVFP